MESIYIDFHCHPSMKPYGKSFKFSPIGFNNPDPSKETSIWYYDAPNIFDRGLQLLSGISKFTQADFSTLAFGNVRMICASLYPIEQGFFKNKLGQGIVSDLVDSFVTGVGKPRVDNIQTNKNYFQDVQREYQFYEALHNREVETKSGVFKYMLVSNYAEVETILQNDPKKDQVIFVIMTIEGLHALNENLEVPIDVNKIVKNVAAIKAWPHPPFFVTFSHHFNNFLCGHSPSLTGIVGTATDQRDGFGKAFSPEGRAVLDAVLSKQNGRRILVDIKHMSAEGREEYFKILESPLYAGQNIPIVVSHGAANGWQSLQNKTVNALAPQTGSKLLHEDINFYDNEIVKVAQSKGIFGLQLDERRLANKETLQAVKHSVFMSKIRHYRAELVWNQIQHVAELLDRNNLPAWDCLALGTDFEGIINPLNGYLTEETMGFLDSYLERYAFNYMSGPGKNLKPANQLSSSDIIQKIFHGNGFTFLQNNF